MDMFNDFDDDELLIMFNLFGISISNVYIISGLGLIFLNMIGIYNNFIIFWMVNVVVVLFFFMLMFMDI